MEGEKERGKKNMAKRKNEKMYKEMAGLVTVFLIEFQQVSPPLNSIGTMGQVLHKK